MLYLDPSNELFRKDRQSPLYVDKSGLLKFTNSVLGSPDRCVCVSHPRRF